MYRSEGTASLDINLLQSELRKKEDDLLQAAHYGKSLLDENASVKAEVQTLTEERAHLLKVHNTFLLLTLLLRGAPLGNISWL